MNIGNRIISLRERRGWTQRELAKRVGINVSVMNRIELNDRPVKDSELIELSRVFEVSTDTLLGIDTKQTDNPELADFERWINDPKSNIFFKEFIESPEDRREALLQMWEILKKQGKA